MFVATTALSVAAAARARVINVHSRWSTPYVYLLRWRLHVHYRKQCASTCRSPKQLIRQWRPYGVLRDVAQLTLVHQMSHFDNLEAQKFGFDF